jgi:hypothetical protein
MKISYKDMERLKSYAIKVIEGKEMTLMVGRNWIVVVSKLYGYDNEYARIRCFGNECVPHGEIKPKEVLDPLSTPDEVRVECVEKRVVEKDISDLDCVIKYGYIIYSAIVAITVDPMDISRLDNDKEIQALLDLMWAGRVLVRPM